ncbi:carboxypeptidase regulatory-like domain-containing protein [bacterium]|nr:MAG: carboxypeptidase regulatory-like domain-containing protein [bacterium]
MRIPPEAGSRDRFLFPELPPGRWEIEARAVVREGQVTLAHKEEVEVPAGDAATATFEVKAALFRGKVTWLGEPVKGLLTLTSLPWNRGSRFGVVLPEAGTFEIVLDKPGLYEAQVADAKGRFQNATVRRIELINPDREIRIELPAGRIAGRVTDAEGRPVARARIHAESAASLEAEEADLPGVAFTRLSATSAEDGSFAIEGAPEGSWTLVARSGDRASPPHAIRLGPDERLEGVDIEISVPGPVEEDAQEENGTPSAGGQTTTDIGFVKGG